MVTKWSVTIKKRKSKLAFEIAGFRNNRGSVKFVTMNHFLIKYSTV